MISWPRQVSCPLIAHLADDFQRNKRNPLKCRLIFQVEEDGADLADDGIAVREDTYNHLRRQIIRDVWARDRRENLAFWVMILCSLAAVLQASDFNDGASITIQGDRIRPSDTVRQWPDRHFVPGRVRDYCMFVVPSSAGGGAMVTGAGVRYPRAECGLFVL